MYRLKFQAVTPTQIIDIKESITTEVEDTYRRVRTIINVFTW